MTTFELNYSRFEQLPQRHQLSTKFHFTIEEVFETKLIGVQEQDPVQRGIYKHYKHNRR